MTIPAVGHPFSSPPYIKKEPSNGAFNFSFGHKAAVKKEEVPVQVEIERVDEEGMVQDDIGNYTLHEHYNEVGDTAIFLSSDKVLFRVKARDVRRAS